MNERDVEEKAMSRWRGSCKSRTKEKRVKKEKATERENPKDSQHTLWVSKVSLSGAAGATEMKAVGIK